MYVMSELVSRGHVRRSIEALRRASTTDEARAVLDEVLPDGVRTVVTFPLVH